jgi:N utilization substance protein B
MSNPRTLARRCATQALYQWQLSGTNLSEIEAQFLEELAMARDLFRRFRAGQLTAMPEQEALEYLLEKYCRARSDDGSSPEPASLEELAAQSCPPEIHEGYFKELLHVVPARLDEIDAAIAEFSERSMAELDPVERAVLRIGGYELLFKPDVPYRVAVNEAINLAKQFGASESHKYVNGLLDKLARKHRPHEASRRAGR